MSWRVLGVATVCLWGILLLVRGNLELVNASTSPCYHHIDACDCSMYCQLSNLLSLPRSTSYNMQCQLNEDI